MELFSGYIFCNVQKILFQGHQPTSLQQILIKQTLKATHLTVQDTGYNTKSMLPSCISLHCPHGNLLLLLLLLQFISSVCAIYMKWEDEWARLFCNKNFSHWILRFQYKIIVYKEESSQMWYSGKLQSSYLGHKFIIM